MNKKNFFKVRVISQEKTIIFTIARWEDNTNDLAFLYSLINSGYGIKIEIEKQETENNEHNTDDVIDVLVYDDRFFVTINTIQQFCEIITLFGISRPLLSITELRRTYQ